MTTYKQQLLLEYLGYSPGAIDGINGKATMAATRDFQADNNLIPDGICGQSTQASLITAVYNGRFREETASTVPAPVRGDFWDDIQFFTREEFRCPCPRCGGFPAEPAEKLVRIADAVRKKAGKPAHVSSGVRCIQHNAELPNSSATSRHLKGWAMDFRVDGMTSTQLDALVGAQAGVAYHYKIDGSYVHMDVVI